MTHLPAMPGAVAAAAAPAESVRAACGPPDQASTLCRTVYELTGKPLAAHLADLLLARPAKVLLIVAVAYAANRLVRRLIRRLVAGVRQDRVQRRLSLLRERAPRVLV